MVLAIVAMVALSPNLHTQTPLSTAPPANGGVNNGGSSGAGTANKTAPSCNLTGDDHEWGDQNETDASLLATHALDDGNGTNDTGGHAEDGCTPSSWDPDSVGDRESAAHAAPEADRSLADVLALGTIGLAPALSGWIASASVGLVAGSGLLVEPLLGTAS